jgi:NADP-dependent 3-hydroxy acid dehydrogenase YdfG
MDPKIKNLFKLAAEILLVVFATSFIYYFLVKPTSCFEIIGHSFIFLTIIRLCIFIHRRYIQKSKKPLEYGKWAIIIDNGSNLCNEIAYVLANEGMSLYIIASTQENIFSKVTYLWSKANVKASCKLHDFEASTANHDLFYEEFEKECQNMHQDGGIGIFLNNFDSGRSKFVTYDEQSMKEIQIQLDATLFAYVNTTSIVFNYMKKRKNGGIITISSFLGNYPAPFSSLYAATKWVFIPISKLKSGLSIIFSS